MPPGLTPPLFESDQGNDQFVARYFFHYFLGAEDIAWLAQFKDLYLSEDEAKALIVVREAGALNNGTYCELTKVDTLTASQALRSQLLDGIFGTLADQVGALGQRHPPQEVRDVVVALCQVRA
jgi:hypothetical protein